MSKNTKKWSDERVAELVTLVGDVQPVDNATVESAAAALETTTLSISSKLRKMGYEVVSLAKAGVAAFTVAEAEQLANIIGQQAGELTYRQLSEQFANGKFSPKQIQGKVLALELTGSIKPAEKVEVASKYTPAEEATFIEMAEADAFIEDIAAALNKEVASVRGKALSMTNKGLISKIPVQRASLAKNTVDAIDTLENIAGMTVEEIATAVDKTVRGVKTTLTRRGIKVANYDGEAKRAKAEAKEANKDA